MNERRPSFENAVGFAQELIRIPSLPGREGEVAARVRCEMEALGFTGIHTDEVGNIVGVIPGTGTAPAALLNAHLDVVAEGAHSEWEHAPFSGEVAGGYLHGRGSMDIKGQLALITHAAASLRDRAKGDLIVAHTVLEERGGWGMQHLLDAGRFQPGVVLIAEATGGDITLGHRGRAELEIVVRGVAGHASAPDRARNPLNLLPEVLERAREVASRQGFDPVLGKASLAATAIDVRPESRNVIPDEVVVVLDWRVLPGDTGDRLVARLEREIVAPLAPLPEGYRVEVRVANEEQRTYTGMVARRDIFTPGFLMGVSHPVVRAASEAAGRRGGEGPAVVRPWGFATDGGWSCGVHGLPTIGFAPGEERFAHTNRERLDLEEARWAYGRYPAVFQAIQSALV